MAKDKEKSINPAAAHRKAEKVRQLKKSRAQLQTQRNEKLARRNPERIQRQIEELKQLETSGDIKQRERDILADLERDLKAVKKAKEALGQKVPDTAGSSAGRGGGSRRAGGEGGRGGSVLGKRQHNGDRKQSSGRRDNSGSDTDESVRRIPMPEDTPPPVPREHRRYFNNKPGHGQQQQGPVIQQQTTYAAAPQVRDLKKEAINKFVPNMVRKKQEAVSGKGGLMEPEEMDQLEAEGYYNRKQTGGDGEEADQEAAPFLDEDAKRLAEEEARFEREMAMVDDDDDGGTDEVERRTRNVHMEEVEDQDA